MKDQLKHGDQARIAEITGYSHDYVKMVIQGRRHNDLVLKVAQQIVDDRDRLTQKNKSVSA